MFKNGKLFGKFNIIDLLIVLVVIAGILFVVKRFGGGNDNDYGTPQQVKLTFFADEAPALLEGKAAIGGPVTDFDESNYLGVLTGFESEPAYTYGVNSATGELVQLPTPNEIFLTFTCEGQGFVAEDGMRVNGIRYCVGGSYVICAGQTRIACRLASIEVIG